MSKMLSINHQQVVIALYHLGGSEHAIDTEDVAVKVAEIAPGRFRWKKYPEQINLEGIRLALKKLSQGKPPLVAGGSRDGWMLTVTGIAWCRAMLGADEADSHGEVLRAKALLLQRTEAFKKFSEQRTEGITIHDVRHFLRIDEYTSRRRRKERLQAVQNLAADDRKLLALVEHLRDAYPEEWQ